MYIYNPNKNKQIVPILDPDYSYHTLEEDTIYNYFKQIHIIEDAINIAGLYIEYEITGFLYEQHPEVYQRTAFRIEEKIKQYFDFNGANLLSDDTHRFFITMFNVNEDKIKQAFLSFHQDLSKRTTEYKKHNHSIKVHCGVYISNIHIAPLEFYMLSKEQFQNTFIHKNCLISTMNSFEDVFLKDDRNNE